MNQRFFRIGYKHKVVEIFLLHVQVSGSYFTGRYVELISLFNHVKGGTNKELKRIKKKKKS